MFAVIPIGRYTGRISRNGNGIERIPSYARRRLLAPDCWRDCSNQIKSNVGRTAKTKNTTAYRRPHIMPVWHDRLDAIHQGTTRREKGARNCNQPYAGCCLNMAMAMAASSLMRLLALYRSIRRSRAQVHHKHSPNDNQANRDADHRLNNVRPLARFSHVSRGVFFFHGLTRK